ncbi:MAG: amidohydrolase family protein [Pirellulaceae bacterium]
MRYAPVNLPRFIFVGLTLILASVAAAAPPSTVPVDGLREHTPAAYALTNVRIVPEPGKVIEKGTLVFRDGVIVAVGADVAAPADARVIDLPGKTVYAGFVDPFTEMSVPQQVRRSGAAHWNELVTPEFDLARHYAVDEELNKKFRAAGITARLVAPEGGIIKGKSVLVSTGATDPSKAVLQSEIAQHVRLTVPRGRDRDDYPNSPMGAVALARQTIYDADWYGKAMAAYKANPSLPRSERNDALAALAPYLGGEKAVIIDAANEQFFDRADRFARELGLSIIIRGSGREYRRLEEVKASGRTIILPVNFPRPPKIGTVEESLDVSLEELMHWDHAPENPARLEKAGVKFALTSYGLKEPAVMLPNVRRAVERGLTAEGALKALTTTPASLVGAESRLGSIGPGKAANLVITDGDLFAKKTKILETWVDGRRFEHAPEPKTDIRGTWAVELGGADGRFAKAFVQLRGSVKSLKGTIRRDADGAEKKDETKFAKVSLRESQLNLTFEGKTFGHEGAARLSVVVAYPSEGKKTWLGSILWADGVQENVKAEQTAGPSASDKEEDEDEEAAKKEGAESDKEKSDGPAVKELKIGEKEEKKEGAEGKKEEDKRDGGKKKEPKPETPALYPVNYPLGDFGRVNLPEQAKVVAIKNATIWTCGAAGKISGATLLVQEGKIIAVGKDVVIPEGAVVIDAAGKHLTPGIIDCHTHMGTDGGVNEATQAITAEVRVGDFVDANDITIYRHLAGGVTSANILHGSANPIGGQNQVIKLRWGLPSEELKFREAPQGVKFALGENVKQSNWGEKFTSRYPQSRMGVEQIIRDAFSAAKDYQRQQEKWAAEHVGLPPRRDLELDALAEVVSGKRWIHCHSYRQDEILALIRVCDDHKIKIGTLQHILEGYKVADAMAKHGVMGSSFSDWWAYKFEVFDAIPYNGSLMHNAGVVVSFNSDDQELARHLNHEAAKAVKYGGVPEEEALKFVTLNPAKQLRIDQYVGSLEPGKQADFVLWSSSPLSTLSRCEQTWVDGRKYFDRAEDQAGRLERDKMRTALMRKILESGQDAGDGKDKTDDESDLWPRHDEFCHGHTHDH